jgi:hypothetical protein
MQSWFHFPNFKPRSISRLVPNIARAATDSEPQQVYAPSAMRPLRCYCWARLKKTAQRTPNNQSMHHQRWGLCSATVGPGQRKPHREPQNWKELVESKTQGTSWGYSSQMTRTKLHQLQMRQHLWKSLNVTRVVTKEIQNCLLIMHDGLVVSDSLYSVAMDWLWNAFFILITSPCNLMTYLLNSS